MTPPNHPRRFKFILINERNFSYLQQDDGGGSIHVGSIMAPMAVRAWTRYQSSINMRNITYYNGFKEALQSSSFPGTRWV